MNILHPVVIHREWCSWPVVMFTSAFQVQLVSESVKIKQEQSLLLSRKQVSTGKLQKAKTSLESLKMRMAQSEDQVAFCLFCGT